MAQQNKCIFNREKGYFFSLRKTGANYNKEPMFNLK